MPIAGQDRRPSGPRLPCRLSHRFGRRLQALEQVRVCIELDQASRPCIRGLRFPVATIVARIADSMTVDEILDQHPDLVAENIAEALRHATLAVRERELPVRHPD